MPRPEMGTFELSRYLGTRLVNIGRTYGHLARDGIEHSIALLEGVNAGGHFVDGTPPARVAATAAHVLA